MNSCEKILAGMNPVIRAYYQGRWLIRKAPVKVAEDFNTISPRSYYSLLIELVKNQDDGTLQVPQGKFNN
jgi:hypothetical protein